MRTFNFKVKNIGREKYLTYIMGEDCELDEDVLDYCEENHLKELIGIIYEEDDDYDYLTYDVSERISLEEYTADGVNCERVLFILRNVAQGLISLKEQSIHLSYILLNKGFMYVSPDNYDISFICLPVESKGSVATEFKGFVRQLLANMQYDVDEDLNYVGKLLTYINGSSFNLRGLVGLTEALMEEAGIEFEETEVTETDEVVDTKLAEEPEVEEPEEKLEVEEPEEEEEIEAELPEEEKADDVPEIELEEVVEPIEESEIEPIKELELEEESEREAVEPEIEELKPEVVEESEPEIEPIEEVEPIEELEPIEEVEPIGELEPIGESEPEIEPIEKLEPEEVSEFEAVEPVRVSELGAIEDEIEELKAEPVELSEIEQGFSGDIDEVPIIEELPVKEPEKEEEVEPEVESQTEPEEPLAKIEMPSDLEDESDVATVPKKKTVKESDINLIKNRIKELVGEVPDAKTKPTDADTIKTIEDLDELLDNKAPAVKKNVIKVNRAAIIQSAAAEHEAEKENAKIEDINDSTGSDKKKPKSNSVLSKTVEDAAKGANSLLNAPKAVPYLIRINTEERIMLGKATFKIGKATRGVDYTVSGNSAISRQHAVITQKDGVCYIKDNKSTNHTFVNGKLVGDGEEVILTHDSMIKLGDEEFLFKVK